MSGLKLVPSDAVSGSERQKWLGTTLRKLKTWTALQKVTLKLKADNQEAQYILTIQDGPKPNSSCSIFLIPTKNARDFLFDTDEGRMSVFEVNEKTSMSYKKITARIIFVEITDPEKTVKVAREEFMKFVPLLIFKGCSNHNIDFLAPGKDADIGDIVFNEDGITVGDKFVSRRRGKRNKRWRRILRFDASSDLTQSEMEYTGSPENPQFIFSKLISDYTRYMAAGLLLTPRLRDERKAEVLILGVGGGSLLMYMRSVYPNCLITAVDISQTMIDVAKRFFGLVEDERMKLVCQDAIEFILGEGKAAPNERKRYDVIVVDASESDKSRGQTFPTLAMSTPEFYEKATGMLTNEGILITNIVCRAKTLRQNNLDFINAVSEKVVTLDVDECVNIIAISWRVAPSDRRKRPLTWNDSNNLEALIKHLYDRNNRLKMEHLTKRSTPAGGVSNKEVAAASGTS